ncbi:glycoside hydrolase family 3 C-terminal domain-containing protein [Algibacillus agarilyticus]|uniref:glycoside hydrolase family 3 C-terminal domain-containing protein n=1 Tax=Algibacillus agarilyticus TaxID=2234133 RepID=UPI000DCFD6F0|nr:glycoside hydrolase family 3 C-terminal domain-containing protein [Algibacillus agarilyticus]
MKTIISPFLLATITCAVTLGCQNTTQPEYHSKIITLTHLNPSLPLDKRVDALVSAMTLDEKISQMFDKAPAIPRLKVPAYKWWNEALHGIARAGKATVFPQAIGLAAMFDEDLMLAVGTAISDEGRAKHHHFLRDNNRSMYTGLTYWSPNINIFRDPRWGRGQETYGEDPYLTTRTAINFINGLQGNNAQYLKSVATLKHYAVHSGPEFSRHSDDYTATAKDLTETYLPAFKDTIAQTQVASIMCAYNRVNGAPACGSNELIQNKLRGEFNFNGYIVSDCGAIADFYDPKSHHVVKTEAEAAAWAVKTGTDLNCGDHHGNTYSYLKEAVERNLITEEQIDIAVKRLFFARFKLGMFDNTVANPYSQLPLTTVGSDKHLALTEEAARKSLVLLKNDKTLPLSGTPKIALIGPNAHNEAILVGNYHGKPVKPITPKTALENRLGQHNVIYAPGSSLTGEVYTHYTAVPANHFSHTDQFGKNVPGLIAQYFPANHFGVQHSLQRIDKNIDFAWDTSPIDNSTEQEMAIKWRGKFTPTENGTYLFNLKNVHVTIDGQGAYGPIKLEKDKAYDFYAESKINHYWHSNVIAPSIKFSWLNQDKNLNKQALKAAKAADVIVFVGGISANLEGEEMPLQIDGFSHGDRTHINLPTSQETLLKQLKATGKPLVYVNMSGSAIALNWQDKNANAIVQGFYPGEATGNALTSLLFGDYSPSGRLPVTFYKGVTDLPDFKDYSMHNRTYKYYTGDVLYPFGYGLSYADFEYKKVSASKNNNGLTIQTSLLNKSDMTAEEVTQVYISMPDAPVSTPIRQLVAYKRSLVNANSEITVKFDIPAEQLMYVDSSGLKQPYYGKLTLSVGSGQGIKIPKQQFVKTMIKL